MSHDEKTCVNCNDAATPRSSDAPAENSVCAERSGEVALQVVMNRLSRAVLGPTFETQLSAEIVAIGEEVRAHERTRIAEWLYRYADEAEQIPGPPQYEDALRDAAAAIERGDYAKEKANAAE